VCFFWGGGGDAQLARVKFTHPQKSQQKNPATALILYIKKKAAIASKVTSRCDNRVASSALKRNETVTSSTPESQAMCVPDLDEVSGANYHTQAHLRSSVTAATAAAGDIVLEPFTLEFEGFTYSSQIAYRANSAPAPVILVFPNYAGLKQFGVDQAVFLAKLGYVGLAVGLYKYPIAERNPSTDSTREERKMHFVNAFNEMNNLLRRPGGILSQVYGNLSYQSKGAPSCTS
jgi:hypothetical protein